MRAALILSILFLILHSPANSTTIRVPQDQFSIQAGLAAASPGDTVLVACGSYFEHDIVMPSGVLLLSESSGGDCAIIDAQGMGRVLFCEDVDGATVIAGFTLTGGYANLSEPHTDYGGGMLCVNSSLQVRDCVFTANEAGYRGGGVFCLDSAPIFTDCLFTENSGGDGGGAGMGCQNSAATISACQFIGNEAIDGGAIFFHRSSGTVSFCLFTDNEAQFFGGAIACHFESSPVISQCTLVRNDGYVGGGIWVAADSHPIIENTIIAGNLDGAGIWVEPSGAPSDPSLLCCDLFGNVDGNYGGEIEDQTGIDGNISAAPFFCDADGDDFTLATVSPCLPGNNDCGVLMGRYGEGCTATSAPAADSHLEAAAWGAVKALY